MVEEVVLACPECGSTEEVGSNDVVAATARGRWVRDANGEPRFHPEGWTEVHWDSQETSDTHPAICEACGWSGPEAELVVPDEEDA